MSYEPQGRRIASPFGVYGRVSYRAILVLDPVRAGAAGERIQAQLQGIQMVLLFLSSVFAANRDRGNDREGRSPSL